MRTILISCFIVFGNFSHSQVTMNRAMINANFGFKNYGEMGFRAQFHRIFTVGAYGSFGNFPVGPRVESSVGPATHNPWIQERNRVLNATVYAGVTTPWESRFSFTALAGPSFGTYSIHENIEVIENPDGSKSLTSDARELKRLGLGFRGEMTFAISPKIGINAGVLGNLNGAVNYFKVHVGICLGMMNSAL